MDVRNTVRDFVIENFYIADPCALSDERSLLDEGIVDSTGILEVIFFLEDRFQITIEDEEMVPENLDSITAIVDFVTRKATP